MKKLTMLLLAMSMCFALTACGISNAGSGTGNSVSESSSQEKQENVTITFKQSGYSDVVKTIEKGESLADIPAPQQKIGYTVTWETVDLTNITEDIIVNAVETANRYIVSYDANGGTVENETQEVTFDAETTLVTPTREDYFFNGWTYEGTAVVSGAKWSIASNVTLVADWIDNRPTYTVTFVDGTKLTEIEVKKGECVAAEDVPTFVGKTGYSATWDITDYTNIQANTAVTAVYTANTYTITYEADGFALDGTTVQLTYDAVCSALDMTLTKEDANFLGWKYGEATYTNQAIWNVAENVTVTPDWAEKDQITVTFVDTDGSTINKTIYEGQDLTDIPTPKAKTGYAVDSVWYADEACTQVATFTDIQVGFTVYAKATANKYIVSYNANSGTVAEETQDVVFNAEYTLATPTHELSYMSFAGWQDESGAIVAATGIWTTDSDVALTAQWTDTRATYTISFVQAGQETKTFTVKEGESFTDIPEPVAKTGYTVEWDTTEFENITEPITVTAIETAKTYTIILDVNGGYVAQTTITVTYGQAYDFTTPIHDERAFDSWTYNGQKLSAQGTWSIDVEEGELTVVAQWGAREWTGNY